MGKLDPGRREGARPQDEGAPRTVQNRGHRPDPLGLERLRDGSFDLAKLQSVVDLMVENAQSQSSFQRVLAPFRSTIPQYVIEVDRVKTETLGLNVDDVILVREGTLTKTSSAFTYGALGTYTLTVGNVGTAATSQSFVVTDTLPLPPEKQIDKLEVLSVASIIADAIDAVFEDTSVSEIFGGANQS